MHYVIMDLEWNNSYNKSKKCFVNEILDICQQTTVDVIQSICCHTPKFFGCIAHVIVEPQDKASLVARKRIAILVHQRNEVAVLVLSIAVLFVRITQIIYITKLDVLAYIYRDIFFNDKVVFNLCVDVNRC